jgi:hypothetical protein
MSEFVEVLKRARSPCGDLFVPKNMADQLFRYIEITEGQVKAGEEAIELLKQIMRMVSETEGGAESFTFTDFVRKIVLRPRGFDGPL